MQLVRIQINFNENLFQEEIYLLFLNSISWKCFRNNNYCTDLFTPSSYPTPTSVYD